MSTSLQFVSPNSWIFGQKIFRSFKSTIFLNAVSLEHFVTYYSEIIFQHTFDEQTLTAHEPGAIS